VIAPYVPTSSIRLMPPEAREHEPRSALDGGADGLDVLRRVLAEAATWLRPGGHLLTETGADQLPAALSEFARHGLAARPATAADDSATVLIGRPVPSPDAASTGAAGRPRDR
jgi:release factor glutamine methyltransferase